MPEKKPQPEPKFIRISADGLRDYVDKMLEHLTKKYLAEHPTEEKDTPKKEEKNG